MPYDVFISYSSKDREWVEHLARRLTSYGLSVWIDTWCILPGDNLVDKINQGLYDSAAAVVIYSRASTASKWVGEESAAAYIGFLEAQRFPEKNKRLIPVKLEECNIPPLQGALNMVDFTGVGSNDTAFENRVRLLLRAFPQHLASFRREPLGVPLVVVSMTADEVESLFSGTAFGDGEVSWKELFEQFAGALVRFLDLTNEDTRAAIKKYLLRYYGTRREEWRPFGIGRTILEVMQERIAEFNDGLDPQMTAPVTPEFWSDEFFSEEVAVRERTALNLSRRGCYLLIDPLALFHPRLAGILRDSQLSLNEAVTILCTSPLDSRLLSVFKTIDQAFQNRLGLLFRRFQTLDPQCVLGVEDPLMLDLWLKAQLPLAVDRLKRVVPFKPKLQIFRDKVDVSTRGVGMLIAAESVPQ